MRGAPKKTMSTTSKMQVQNLHVYKTGWEASELIRASIFLDIVGKKGNTENFAKDRRVPNNSGVGLKKGLSFFFAQTETQHLVNLAKNVWIEASKHYTPPGQNAIIRYFDGFCKNTSSGHTVRGCTKHLQKGSKPWRPSLWTGQSDVCTLHIRAQLQNIGTTTLHGASS